LFIRDVRLAMAYCRRLSEARAAMLIVFGGRSGTGKTRLSRALAQRLGAVHLRIDTVEEAIIASNGLPVGDAGYQVGYAVAEDNLRLGRVVIADAVNPLEATRDAWRDAAARAGVPSVEIEQFSSLVWLCPVTFRP
jgi:predicted kinase